jgi:hypothetical protein
VYKKFYVVPVGVVLERVSTCERPMCVTIQVLYFKFNFKFNIKLHF